MDESLAAPSTALVLVRPTGTRTRDWPPAAPCSGTRTDGEPCGRKATRGTDVCAVHGAQLPSVRAAAARQVDEVRLRVIGLSDPALDTVERALTDPDVYARLRAAAMVLDRSAPRPAAGQVVVEVRTGQAPPVSATERLRARIAADRPRLLAMFAAQQATAAPGSETSALDADFVDY